MARKKKKNNFWLIFFGILVLAAIPLLMYGKKQGWFGEDNKTKVAVEEIKRRTITETVKANGKVYPIVEVKISSDVSGELKFLAVEEGDTVAKNMLLAEIDDEIYRSAVDRAKAAVQNASANVSNARARLSQSKTNKAKLENDFERNKLLFSEKIISRIEYENGEVAYLSASDDVDAAIQSVEAAKFNVESAEANLKEAKDNLKRTKIYAPMSGIISVLNVEQGERIVGTAQMTGTELMRIADFDKMEVRVDVSENDVLRVSKNDNCIIEVDAYMDKTFNGRVTSIASSANGIGSFTNDQVTNFTVKILLNKNSYKSLLKSKRLPFRPGMSASVEIETEVVKNIVSVPVQAVTTRLNEDENGKETLEEVVFLETDGVASKKVIKTGIQDEKYIQILNGVSEGVNIITAPFNTINKLLKGEEELKVVEKEELFKDK